jgi:hypothetical protein
MECEKGILASTDQKPEDQGKDRPIDPMSGKKTARKRARSGVELGKRTGASPSYREYLTTPVF